MSHEYVRAPGSGQVHRAQAAYDPNQIYTLQSIEAIQNWVDHEANNMETNHTLHSTYTLQNNQFNGYERMYSSAGESDLKSANDCLIHSLLTAISSLFRKLSRDNRNQIAFAFRRVVFVELLNREGNNTPYGFTSQTIIDMKDRLPSTNYLTDDEMKYLLNRYNFNVYIYGPAQSLHSYSWRLIQSSQDDNSPLILLYNSGNFHFESIRNPNGDQYLFTLDFISKFQSIKNFIPQHIVNLHSTKLPCNFSKFDIIQHNTTRKIYMVYNIVLNKNENKCEGIIVFELTREVLTQLINELNTTHAIGDIIDNLFLSMVGNINKIINILNTENLYKFIKHANNRNELIEYLVQLLKDHPINVSPAATAKPLTVSPAATTASSTALTSTKAPESPAAGDPKSPSTAPTSVLEAPPAKTTYIAKPLVSPQKTPAASSESSTQMIIKKPTTIYKATLNNDGSVKIYNTDGNELKYTVTATAENTPLTFTVTQIIPSK